MNEPVSPSSRPATAADSHHFEPSPERMWFRTRDGRRFGVEIAVVVVVKLALLGLLWLVFIQPWSRLPGKPATVVQQIYAPVTLAERHD